MKQALIVFPDEWLAYSPTIINLKECLKNRNYNVRILTFNLEDFVDNTTIMDADLISISKSTRKWKKRLGSYEKWKIKQLKTKLNELNNTYDLVFGVDSIGYLAARSKFSNVTFLSLEVDQSSYFEQCKKLGIEKLIIQTEERANYLLNGYKCEVYFLPNSPIIDQSPIVKEQFSGRLLYLGNVKNYYGIEECILATNELDDCSLTVKGIKDNNYYQMLLSKYQHLINSNKLIFDFSYTEQDKIIDSIKEFDIGFAFYDMKLIGENDFNYLSSPSGKVFNYFAAGIPVIGQQIIGMNCVEENQAGILLQERTIENIKTAVEKIKGQYSTYSKQATIAAQKYDFKKAFSSIIESIEQ